MRKQRDHTCPESSPQPPRLENRRKALGSRSMPKASCKAPPENVPLYQWPLPRALFFNFYVHWYFVRVGNPLVAVRGLEKEQRPPEASGSPAKRKPGAIFLCVRASVCVSSSPSQKSRGKSKGGYGSCSAASSKAFKACLAETGLSLRPMEEDGNCFFRAIADQIDGCPDGALPCQPLPCLVMAHCASQESDRPGHPYSLFFRLLQARGWLTCANRRRPRQIPWAGVRPHCAQARGARCNSGPPSSPPNR